MTILMMDGLDAYTEATSVSGSSIASAVHRWSVASNFTFMGTDFSRWSGGAGFKSTHYLGLITSTLTLPNPFTVGFALWRPVGTPSYSSVRVPFRANDNVGNPNGAVGCAGSEVFFEQANYKGSPVYSTSSPLIGGVWQYWEIKIYSHETAGYCEVRINGVEVLNATSQDTLWSSVTASFYLSIVYNLASTYIDDVYVTDGEFLGPVKVKTFKPDDDGTYTDFAPLSGSNYENVDEIPYDEDTSYNEGSSIGDKDTVKYTVGALGGPVKAVQLDSVRKKSSLATAKVKNLIRSNSTDYLSSSEVDMQTDYIEDVEVYEDDPDDSNPWTQTKIEAAEFGVQITSLSTTTTTTT